MITTILSCFVFAFLILFVGNNIKGSLFKWVTIFPAALFIYFLTFITKISSVSIWQKLPWIPQMGVSLDFKLDGLSLLFALLITGIGTLIFLYSSFYLKEHRYIHKFYSYLTLFMGSMLGIVLSDNLLVLFMFWELTSISSFFLIGFKNKDKASRKGAMLAYGITSIGGFFLLAGAVLLYMISGTYSIQELISHSSEIQQHSLYIVATVFIFIGAFTKSAQFPFYSWLPQAMKAPTPVSAYLHSATMVKAGVYLLARVLPILGTTLFWNYTLIIVGGFTMLYAAVHSVMRTDLKEILAYSTVSALGMMVLLLGIGSPYAIQAVGVFIVVHALYKAALFMVAGGIDHSVHTREITSLSGLRKIAPQLAVAGFLVAISSAGVPLTIGFIGKDLIYASTLSADGNIVIILTAIALITNILLLCAGFLTGIKPFFGKYTPTVKPPKPQSAFLFIPPLILGVLSIILGIFPQSLQNTLLGRVTRDIIGYPIEMSLKLIPDSSIIIWLSVGTIVVGVLLYFFIKSRKGITGDRFNLISDKTIFTFVYKSKRMARAYTKFMQSGYLRIYIIIITTFLTVIVSYRLFSGAPIHFNLTDLTSIQVYDVIVFAMIVGATTITVITHSRLSAILSLGVVGFSISLMFVFYGAPDLAMTQFAIDTLTVVLFVLVLFKLPTYIKKSRRNIQIRDLIISIAFGSLIAIITSQALISPADKEMSKFFAENAYLMAKGKNVVNVILVDFRGMDTLIESIVLSVSAIGVYGLLKYTSSASEGKIQQ